MGKVVTYGNSNHQCFCQIKLDNGERVLISIVTVPRPSVKVMKLAFFGLWPVQTIWEYNPTMAGGYEHYVRNMMLMFQDMSSQEARHPLDVLRDRLLPCSSISEVRESLLDAEHRLSE
jgi:hypothetical protein